MAGEKVPKELTKKPEKLPEKKKGLPVLQILGAIVLLVLVGGFLWLNSMNSLGDVDTGVPKIGIDVLETPLSAKVGDTITITWRVLGVTADSSEVWYSANPRGGFGNDTDVSALTGEESTYEEKSSGKTTASEFEGQVFTTSIDVKYVPIFMRIHAVSGGKNYWTGEIAVMEE